MATQSRSLGVTNVDVSAVKSIESTHNKVVLFGAHGSGTLELPVGTPMAFNEDTGFWVPWNVTGAATSGDGFLGVIRAFVYPDPVEITDAGEVHGSMMFAGRIGLADITQSTTYNPGFTLAALKAAIQGDWANVDAEVAIYAATGAAMTLRASDIIVEDVEQIR